ncbi:MBL fold metallo-hydrolase [Candidatus Poriferisodalis sp.]|uniref:MBL fold metallo-hydrolase n=1 Tax=Candidatus Poriferisodalis sp. TaxID=3101277 RepID=UPI003B59EB98
MTDIHQLHLGHMSLPESHPRAAERICEICCYVIDHPDGIIVVDTGPRAGHPFIDKLYAPDVVPVTSALAAAGFDEREVAAVVNTHLHFDHCGQNRLLGHAPVWVTEAELQVSTTELYTVPEWAHIETSRLRLATDGELIAGGIQLLHTPGHSPGHLSVAVQTERGLEIVVGQACYSCAEFAAATTTASDMHDPDWHSVGLESVARLRSLNPTRAHFSHDAQTHEA